MADIDITALTGFAANFKLFGNAAGNGVEWAAGNAIGTFTREMDAATGDFSYTGVGFKPSMVIFFGGVNATSKVSILGVASGVIRYTMSDCGVVSADTYALNPTACILLYEATGKVQYAVAKTWDADGFTLTWTRVGATASGTATMFYIAFR